MNYLDPKERIDAIKSLVYCQFLLSRIESRDNNFNKISQIIEAELSLIKEKQKLTAS